MAFDQGGLRHGQAAHGEFLGAHRDVVALLQPTDTALDHTTFPVRQLVNKVDRPAALILALPDPRLDSLSSLARWHRSGG